MKNKNKGLFSDIEFGQIAPAKSQTEAENVVNTSNEVYPLVPQAIIPDIEMGPFKVDFAVIFFKFNKKFEA